MFATAQDEQTQLPDAPVELADEVVADDAQTAAVWETAAFGADVNNSDLPAEPVEVEDLVVSQGIVASQSIAATAGTLADDASLPPAPTEQEDIVVGDLIPNANATQSPDEPTLSQANDATDAADSSATPERPVFLKDAGYSDAASSVAVAAKDVRPVAGAPLTIEAIYPIVREVAVADSGDDAYSAVRRDREFQTQGHAAYQRRHFGLSFGVVLFTQESGRLGRVLRLMHQRDAAEFARLFGQHADELLNVTNAATPEERLRPVGGEVLWQPTWVDRFKVAGREQFCQNAQNEEAIEGLFRPMLNTASKLGLTTDRALAMVFDRVVVAGVGQGTEWVIEHACPFRTERHRTHALQVTGHSNVESFQTANQMPSSGVFTHHTLAALTEAVRRTETIPLPGPDELVARLTVAATGSARKRLDRLRLSDRLTDTVLQLR